MIHRACRMEHFSPMFAWHIVSLQPRERLVVVLAEKSNDLSKYPAGTLFTCICGWNIMYLHMKPQK